MHNSVSNDTLSGVGTNKSPLLEQYSQKKEQLEAELQKLELVQKKYSKDLASLEAEKQQLDQRESELCQKELTVQDKKREASTLDEINKSTAEIQSDTANLLQIANQLQTQIDQVTSDKMTDLKYLLKDIQNMTLPTEETQRRHSQLEVEFQKYKNQEIEEKQKVLSRKLIQKRGKVERLEHTLTSLKEEVELREHDVRAIELAAIEQQKKIDDANHYKEALERRKTAAEDKKAKILASLAQRDEKRAKLIAQREQVRKRREAAENELENLDDEEVELKKAEEEFSELRLKDEESARLAILENKKKMKQEAERSMVEMTQRSMAFTTSRQSTMKDRTESFIQKYETDQDALERRFERAERQLTNRKMAIDTEQRKWTELWDRKHEEADKLIDTLESRIETTPEELAEELQEIERHGEELQKKIAAEQAEIQKLSSQPGQMREIIEQMKREISEERERIGKLNRELDFKVLDQETEQDHIDTNEIALQYKKEQLERELVILQQKEKATKRMLDLYIQQQVIAEQRSETLKEQYGQLGSNE